ncbi:hypothetical protein [Streptomyces sp. NPDC053427]|uniref:hypothetical protein n=1 Tax=Streptomyces sp. NPDC053427 TaxID=3365701 RepID=UPI0037CFF08B
MKQRTRISGTQSGRRTRARALTATGLALATVATVGGCALTTPRVKMPPLPSPSPFSSYNPNDPTPSDEPSYDTFSPSPTEETYNPDGSADVNGTGCDFSESRHTFTYTIHITNPSLSDTYSYDISVLWLKDKPADGKNYGSHRRSVTVGPGDTESYDAEFTINQSTWDRFWFTCHIDSVQKSRA